jgi:hypothetical protein
VTSIDLDSLHEYVLMHLDPTLMKLSEFRNITQRYKNRKKTLDETKK